MNIELLPFLREPGTGDGLELEMSEKRGNRIWSGALISKKTKKSYPIEDGIPRFVPTENYCNSFGLQWNRFSKVQMDSANGCHYSRNRFLNETGWTEKDLKGKWVLDAGAGCGRFSEIALSLGAKVIALDYSNAVDAAQKNLNQHPNLYLVQGDILSLPFLPNSFDYAYSIGVLQHTPNPTRAIESILKVLKPEGKFAFTIYGRKWYTPLYSKYLVRGLTKKIEPKKLLTVIEKSMPILFPLTDVLFRIPGIGKIARFAIPIANYVEKTDFTKDLRYDEAILDTFDMLAPAFDSPLNPREVKAVLKKSGVSDYHFKTDFPVNVVGTAN